MRVVVRNTDSVNMDIYYNATMVEDSNDGLIYIYYTDALGTESCAYYNKTEQKNMTITIE